MKLYLCGPINGCSDTECIDWRSAAKAHYPYAIDPMRRDYRGSEHGSEREIVELDKLDIRNADALLVNYIKPSVGTSMEILYAWEHGKPIVLVCESGLPISPWLVYHCTAIVHSMRDAFAKLQSIAA